MFSFVSKLAIEWHEKIAQTILGFFTIIPQFIYFLYASAASLLDVMQYLIRKLAGLDTYYVDGQAKSGDIVLSFIRGILGIDKSDSYSALSTVFWSLVIFGAILLILTTIFAIIKAHYNYDAKKSHPFTIIGQSLKSFALMAIVPITAVFGLALSEVVLGTLDTITSYSVAGQDVFTITDESGNVISSIESNFYNNQNDPSLKKNPSDETNTSKQKTYSSFDFFTAVNYTTQSTFSGTLFRTAAYSCNRVRNGTYSPATSEEWSKWSNFGVFYTTNSGEAQAETVAAQIDYAFVCALRLREEKQGNVGVAKESKDENWKYLGQDKEDRVLLTSYMYGYGALTSIGLYNVKCFSKFNVGLVFYYYNLWGFNYFIGFAGIIALIVILGNVVFGLITRLIQLLALFFVFPPLVGIAPLDDGQAFKNWRKQFVADVLMAYGAIVGMNLFFLILPFINTISFFGPGLEILDSLMDMLIILAGLTVVKNLIKLLSSFIGASDANATGEETRKAVGELGGKAFVATAKAGSVGLKVGKGAMKFYGGAAKLAGKGAGKLGSKIANSKLGQKIGSGLHNAFSQEARDRRSDLKNAKKLGVDTSNMDESQVKALNYERYQRREKRHEIAQGVVKGAKTAGKGLKYAAAALTIPFGGEVVNKKDADGNDIKGTWDATGTLKGVGNAVLDISKAGIKLAGGDLLRVNAVGKKANESGYLDPAKMFIKEVMGKKVVKGEFGKALTTKKEKEDRELAAASEQQRANAEAVENSKQALKELQRIANILNGGGTP